MDHMTRVEFEKLVLKALEELPKAYKDKLDNVDVVIEERFNAKLARDLGLSRKGRILGLYHGVPLKERTHYYGMVLPDKITLFKQNIEKECKENSLDIYEEIKHTLQHEIAHHFGISDKRLNDLDVY